MRIAQRMILVAAALIASGLGPAAVVAQDTAAAPRPFVRGGVYDKPFEHAIGRTAFGGYAEAHARFARVDGATEEFGFVAKRFNLFASARVSSAVRFASELEYEDGGEEVKLEFAAIDVRLHPAATLRGGMILSPVGRFNLSHDSPLNEFTDRPLASTEIIGVALSEPGFGLLGSLRAGTHGRLTYELYATNGFHDGLVTASDDGTRVPLGRGNHEDNNASPALVGRVAWSPLDALEVGVSAHQGAYNVFRQDGLDIQPRRNLSLRVLDLDATAFGVRFQGELVSAAVDLDDGLRATHASRQRGWYAEFVRELGVRVPTLPQSTLAAKVRLDAVDFDSERAGDTVKQVTAGLTFRPTRESALKLDVVRGRARDDFSNPSERFAVLISVATYF
ncbi:MAG: hypothetical protein FJ202_07550 [Gemmatimonadetes bacterium]|nr:hypothetical protein [Gemmatimonadota bacterium]